MAEDANTDNGENAAARKPTYGENMVGVTFNPGGNAEVNSCKANFAAAIDQLHRLSKQEGLTNEQKAHFKYAIRQI